MSSQLSYSSFVPFLVFNRFFIIAIYCLASVISKIVLQVKFNQYLDFQVCYDEFNDWFYYDFEAPQTCKDKYQVFSQDQLTKDFMIELDEKSDDVDDQLSF